MFDFLGFLKPVTKWLMDNWGFFGMFAAMAMPVILLALGIHFSGALGCDTITLNWGAITFMIGDVKISLSGLAVASIVGILLNAILPGNDYKFGEDKKGDESVNFQV